MGLSAFKIDKFEGAYRFLSNFWDAHPFDYNGKQWNSVEAAYQASKTLDERNRERIRHLNPSLAKRAGRRLVIRADWEDVKLNIMEELLRVKFNIPELKEQLIGTDDANLVEGNWWGDTFWGVCRGVGTNHLGVLLMKIRQELIDNQAIK